MPQMSSPPDSARHTVLNGTRILDFSAMIAGPYCARWLSDLGAEVVKVESREGDHMRSRAPTRDGHSSFFAHLNAGKRFLALDLKKPQALALAKDLTMKSDVLIEAYRPGVMKRLGLGPQVALELNPRLIYCSISGFGQTGSAAQRPAYAPVVHAASGYYMSLVQSAADDARPPNSAVPLADMLTSAFAGFSIQTALLQRERTGKGSVIDLNLMDSMMSVMPYEFQAAQFPLPNLRPQYRPLKTSDGYIMVAPINAKNFIDICKATGHPEWQSDPLLATDQARFANWPEYMLRVEAWTSQRSSAECEQQLTAAGVPCSRYRRMREVINDPQFAERQTFSTVRDAAGELYTTNLPFSLDRIRPHAGSHIGRIGEDSPDVLNDWLQLEPEQINELIRQQVVFHNGAATI